MARDIPFSTSHFLWTDVVTLPISAYPFSLTARFRADSLADANDSGCIVGVFGTGATIRYLMYPGIGGDAKIRATVQRDATTAVGWGGAGISTATWYSATLVIAGNTDRRLYVGTSRTDSTSPSIAYPSFAINHLVVGVWSGPTLPLDGQVAEAGLYNIALSDADVASLSKGYTPDQVRPDGLVGYWRLMGRSSPEPDLVGTLPLTLVGTPGQYPHPRVLRPRRRQLFVPVAAAPGGFEPQYAARNNVLLQSGVAA